MKCCLISLVCLSTLTMVGQGLNVSWNRFVNTAPTATTPLTISSTLFRWYVSTDVPVNVVVSNQWTDRIVGTNMWQMDTSKSPTNGPVGIRFSGAQSVTNNDNGLPVGNITGCGGCDTFFFIFTPDGAAGEEGIFSDIGLGNYSPGMNTANLRYAGTVSGGPATITALSAGTTNDVIVKFTSTNTIWYVNGVSVKTNVTVGVDTFAWGRIGLSGVGSYKGNLFEVGVYTNFLISDSVAVTLHTYATNTYHYSP